MTGRAIQEKWPSDMVNGRDAASVPLRESSLPIVFSDSDIDILGARLALHLKPLLSIRDRRRRLPPHNLNWRKGSGGQGNARAAAKVHWVKDSIFLWLPDRTEDRSGLVCKIITFSERIGSRVCERGKNDALGVFLRFNGISEKNNKTGFKDRCDRSLFSASLHSISENFGTLRYTSLLYLPLPAHLCKLATTHDTQTPHTSIEFAFRVSLSV